MKKLDFRVRLEVDSETGRTLAVYLQIRKGHASRVEEIVEGAAFANYDRNGLLLGLELLAPCDIAVFDKIVRQEPKEVREFFQQKIPREMAKGA